MEEPKNNNRKILYIIVAAIIVVLIAVGVAFALKAMNSNTTKTNTPTQQSVSDLIKQAATALKNNDKTKSKELYLEAQQQIKTLPKSDATTNKRIDVEAQLFDIEHS